MMRRLGITLLAMFLAVPCVRADGVGGFDPPRSDVSVPCTIEVHDSDQEIRMPMNLLNQLRASADQEESYRAQMPTMIAGVMLALSFGFGGVWLARYRGQLRGTGLLVAMTSLLLLGTGTVWADRAVSRPAPKIDRPTIAVKVAPKGDAIQIVLSKEALETHNAKK